MVTLACPLDTSPGHPARIEKHGRLENLKTKNLYDLCHFYLVIQIFHHLSVCALLKCILDLNGKLKE